MMRTLTAVSAGLLLTAVLATAGAPEWRQAATADHATRHRGEVTARRDDRSTSSALRDLTSG